MTIDEAQQDIIAEFSLYDDWMDKYETLIQIGKELPMIDEQYKVEERLIKGCQSKVWIHAEEKDGKIFYTADSDAIITKGLANLIIKVLSGHTPEEIADADLYFIDKIGLKSHLSPTRSNGLVAMIDQIRWYATAAQAKQN